MNKWVYIENYDPLEYFEQVDVLVCRKLIDGVIQYAAVNIHGLTISKIELKAKELEETVYGK